MHTSRNSVFLTAIFVLFFFMGLVSGCSSRGESEIRKKVYLSNPRAGLEFKNFFNSHRAEVKETLRQFGVMPYPDGPFKSEYEIDIYVSDATEEDIRSGRATGNVTIRGHDLKTRGLIFAQLFLWFERFATGGPWYLITDGGYLTWIGQEGEKAQGFPPDFHVAFRKIYPNQMHITEWATRSRSR
jgi:hypothetical protein